MANFDGKRGLVLGVANKRSIAWAIAGRLADGGATLAFTYQGERLEGAVRELAGSVGSPLVTECDVRSDEDVPRRCAGGAALQRHGSREGGARRLRSLPSVGPGAEEHPRQRRLVRTGPDAR